MHEKRSFIAIRVLFFLPYRLENLEALPLK
jgi:hypothetical protein